MDPLPPLFAGVTSLLLAALLWSGQGRSALPWVRARLMLGLGCLLFCVPLPGALLLAAHLLLFAGLAGESAAWYENFQLPHWRPRLLLPLAVGCGGFAAVFFLTRAAWPAAQLLAAGLLAAQALILLLRAQGQRLMQLYGGLLALVALALLLHGLQTLAAPGDSMPALYALALLLPVAGGASVQLLWLGQQQQQALERLALVDPLTDASNQRGFYSALSPWLALARRPGNPSALILIDIDHFKRVNDDYGHPVGDLVLKSVVQAGQRQLRDSDLLARLGGEEFAVLLPRTSLEDALLVAERMRAAIAGLPIKTGRALFHITASLGVTTLRADDSTLSLFKRADEALAAAKLAGRNTVLAAGE